MKQYVTVCPCCGQNIEITIDSDGAINVCRADSGVMSDQISLSKEIYEKQGILIANKGGELQSE